MRLGTIGIGAVLVFCAWLPLPGARAEQAVMTPVDEVEKQNFAWRNGLKETYFGNREIAEDDVIVLEAPMRAEDSARVPLQIKARIPQTEARYIKTISLVIDANPAPLAGRFRFTPKSGRADLSLRVRVNDYTMVRAIAETNDGALHMSAQYVKAAGGCSAPVGTDLDAAMARLGKIKLKTRDPTADEPTTATLNISHPNITGLQMDQLTHLYVPPHFVKEVRVSFDHEPIFVAETDIAISEDPSFGFDFVADRDGELVTEVIDSKGMKFSDTHPVKAVHY
ncbi:MAG: quinoprotein dehydrogenase-associated SoxYZ-like carrier [Gammaproteobacteria bacterium]